MVNETKARPAPARAALRRKKASSDHTLFVNGSCRTERASSRALSACCSVRANDSSRPRIRTRTLLSSGSSGVMRPSG